MESTGGARVSGSSEGGASHPTRHPRDAQDEDPFSISALRGLPTDGEISLSRWQIEQSRNPWAARRDNCWTLRNNYSAGGAQG